VLLGILVSLFRFLSMPLASLAGQPMALLSLEAEGWGMRLGLCGLAPCSLFERGLSSWWTKARKEVRRAGKLS
jgi:hypothetical protein